MGRKELYDKYIDDETRELWSPSASLCWKGRILHQLWRSDSGNSEWREVPVFPDPEIQLHSNVSQYLRIDQIEGFLLSDPGWMEAVAMTTKINIDRIRGRIKAFPLHLKSIGRNGATERDVRQHFKHWLLKSNYDNTDISNPDSYE